jgi:hypothetical protein
MVLIWNKWFKSADYQEDTVLDLFVFKFPEKKYNKKLAVRRLVESILMVMKMKPENTQPDESALK